jgi:hypothetical protein
MSAEQRKIGMAVQKGPMVYVYDEKNRQIFSMAAGNGPDDGLKGYTPSRVNIKRGRVIPDSPRGKLMAPPRANFQEVYAAGEQIASNRHSPDEPRT